VNDLFSYPCKTGGKIRLKYILIFKFFRIKLEDKNSAPNDSKRSLTSIYS
jgi:hypothetical protein